MPPFARAATVLALVVTATPAPAAGPKEIDAAIQKGCNYLKAQAKSGRIGSSDDYGIGRTALAGLALLEAKTPVTDPTMKAIAAAVRDASYREHKTYPLALALLFLDKLEDPADVPLIQMLAVRLLAGQNGKGGWIYESVEQVPADVDRWLRAGLKATPAAPKGTPGPAGDRLHPVVREYAAALWARRKDHGDDNSNTQFATLGVWAARKHGVPVEPALDLIEKRFLASQNPQSGGWAYDGGSGTATGTMTCAGLLGLSTGVARRADARLRAEAAKEHEPPPKGPAKPADPFFSPPPRSPGDKSPPKRAPDPVDRNVQAAMQGLGVFFVTFLRGGASQPHEYYFLWSVERVGVIFGVNQIGGVDWYAVGADALVRTQGPDGSWPKGGDGADPNTCFAILFLTKANLATDLSSKVRNVKDNELRAGTPKSEPVASVPAPPPPPMPPRNPLPTPAADPAAGLASELIKVPDADWAKALERARDAKGVEYTRVLALAAHRIDGTRKKQVREALAERLTRQPAAALRTLAKDADPEVRRGAVLACAMKDDKAHVPDLIDRLTDDEEFVVRAAYAGLKSLTGQDFGPRLGASKAEHKAAAEAWRNWWAKKK